MKPLNGGYKSNYIIPLIRNNKFTVLKNMGFQKKRNRTEPPNIKKTSGITLPSRLGDGGSVSILQGSDKKSYQTAGKFGLAG